MSHLDERVVFVTEAFVHAVYAFAVGSGVSARPLDLYSVKLDVTVHDKMNQIVDIRTLRLTEEKVSKLLSSAADKRKAIGNGPDGVE